jgi:hypothetical protein
MASRSSVQARSRPVRTRHILSYAASGLDGMRGIYEFGVLNMWNMG